MRCQRSKWAMSCSSEAAPGSARRRVESTARPFSQAAPLSHQSNSSSAAARAFTLNGKNRGHQPRAERGTAGRARPVAAPCGPT
jgi:hypothetical protein